MTKEQVALEFLRRVLPAGQPYYSASERVGTEFKNTPVNQFEQLVRENFYRSFQGVNTYFGCSAYAQGWYKENPSDTKSRFRTQRNAVCQKALWIDLDCGKPGSRNPDAHAGLIALGTFLTTTGLPVPLLVGSGSGIHAYWTFTQSIPTEQWTRLALGLKALTAFFDLPDIDHSRTADAASVLRLPGTINYKNDEAKEVRLLEWSQDYDVEHLTEIIETCTRTHGVLVTAPKSLTILNALDAPPELTAHMTSALDNDGPLRNPQRIIAECQQVRDCGSADYLNWYNAMTILKRCVKGEEVIHLLSQYDYRNRYDPAVVSAKWQQCLSERAGPARCETFHGQDPETCEQCKYWGSISTPLQLGDPHRPVFEPRVVPGPALQPTEVFSPVVEGAPEMELNAFSSKEFLVVPQGFSGELDSGVWYFKPTEVGKGAQKATIIEPVKISEVPFYLHHKCVERSGGKTQLQYAIRLELPERDPVDALFSMEDLGLPQTLKWFANHSAMPLHPNFNNLMGVCMQTYIAQLQNKLPEVHLRRSFGWTQLTEKGPDDEAFVYGPFMYHAGGKTPVNLSDRCSQIANNQYTQAGSLELWKAIPKMYSLLDQKAAQLFICAGFAAPFMKFAVGPAKNLVMYIWEVHGGRGKTTLLRNINSIWGHPKFSMGKANDTVSARYQILSTKRNLPHSMDELTTMREEELADMLYDISTGQEKAKSNSGGTTLAEPGVWETVVFASSNKSVYEAMQRQFPQSTAPSMRVLEIKCDFTPYSGTEVGRYIEQTTNLVEKNYGLAGPYFLERCFERPGIFQEVAAQALKWDEEVRGHPDERFWTYGLGMAISVGRLLKELDLVDYDMEALDLYARDLVSQLRRQVKSKISSGADLLVEFLSKHIEETVTVQCENRPADTKETINSGLDTYVVHKPAKSITARFELDSQTAYVSSQRFGAWCSARNVSLDSLLSDLEGEGIYTRGDKIQMSLGRGVPSVERGRLSCYRFHCAGLTLPDPLLGLEDET